MIISAASAGAFELVVPGELLIELTDVLTTRPSFTARVSPERCQGFIALIKAIGMPTPPYLGPFPSLTRDPNDDDLLAYALRDQVDFLVTGDRDLLDLADSFNPPKMIDPGSFVRELRSRGLV